MEWVETTGKTVAEAKETALDRLGVADDDAEFEILEEPRNGLFGLIRGEARVRARIRPTEARPKQERKRGRGSAPRNDTRWTSRARTPSRAMSSPARRHVRDHGRLAARARPDAVVRHVNAVHAAIVRVPRRARGAVFVRMVRKAPRTHRSIRPPSGRLRSHSSRGWSTRSVFPARPSWRPSTASSRCRSPATISAC